MIASCNCRCCQRSNNRIGLFGIQTGKTTQIKLNSQAQIIKKLISALEFYGDEKTWCAGCSDYSEDPEVDFSLQGWKDNGDKARQTLNDPEIKKWIGENK